MKLTKVITRSIVLLLLLSGYAKATIDAPMISDICNWLLSTIAISQKELKVPKNQVKKIFYTPESKLCYVNIWGKTLRAYDALTNEKVMIFKGHSEFIVSFSLNNRGTYLAAGGNDGKTIIWDTNDGKILYEFNQGRCCYYKMYFVSGDRYLVTHFSDGAVSLFDLFNGRLCYKNITLTTEFIDSKLSCKYCVNAKDYIAICLDDAIVVRKGTEQLCEVPLKVQKINSLCFSSDGNSLAVGINKHEIITWDLKKVFEYYEAIEEILNEDQLNLIFGILNMIMKSARNNQKTHLGDEGEICRITYNKLPKIIKEILSPHII